MIYRSNCFVTPVRRTTRWSRTLCCALSALFCFLLLASAASAADPYFVKDLGSCQTEPGGWGSGSTDTAGNLYIPCGEPANKIHIYDADGQKIREVPTGLAAPVTDVAPSATGDFLYVAVGDGPPRRLNRQGDGSYSLDVNWRLGDYQQYPYSPGVEPRGYYIATDTQGNVYVAHGVQNQEPWSNHMVIKFNATTGAVMGAPFGGYKESGASATDGTFQSLRGLAVSPDGQFVYTVDGNPADRVQRWDKNAAGNYEISTWQLGTDTTNDNGCVFPGGAWSDSSLSSPYAVEVDSAGNVYVLNTSCNEVLKFDSAGTYLTGNDLGANYPEGLVPHGMAVSRNGERVLIPSMKKMLTVDDADIDNTYPLVVTTTADHDDGSCTTADCSLREAINAAVARAGAQTINFAPGLSGSINLGTALPDLATDLTINGPGAGVLTVRRNAGSYRIFTVPADFTVTISGLTIANGLANQAGTGSYGGGILNDGTLTVSNSNLSGNISTEGGGGIHNQGTLTVSNSTLSGNSTNGDGGGILNWGATATTISKSTFSGNRSAGSGAGIANAELLTLSSSTFSGNQAGVNGGGIVNWKTATVGNSTFSGNSAAYGGGLFNANATLTLSSSIVANTGASANGPDCHGTITSQGYNLIENATGCTVSGVATGNITGTDPKLGPLQNNGGPTFTHALLSGSPAIDAGNDATAPATDQRGVARVGRSDIGAYEASGYSISGRITNSSAVAISGVSVSRGAGSTPVLTDSNGNYTFTGVPAATYTLTPTKSGYAFSPATRSITVGTANITGQNFTGYNTTLSGRVAFSNGTGIANVQVRLGTGRNVLTNGAGYYTFTAMVPGGYTVTPVLAGYSFDPALRQVTVGTTNIGGFNFIGGYTITGRLYTSSGTGLPNLRVYRTGSTVAAVTNSAGYYSFYGVVNGSYTITPDATQGYGYTPQSRTITVNGVSVGAQNFVGTTGYRIIGRITNSSGVAIANVSVTRSGQSTPVTTNSSGYYTFNGVPNGTYTITPSLSGKTFTPTTKSVTVNGADSGGQNFVGSGP